MKQGRTSLSHGERFAVGAAITIVLSILTLITLALPEFVAVVFGFIAVSYVVGFVLDAIVTKYDKD